MTVKKDVERLEEALEIIGPPSDELIALALSSILGGSWFKAITGESLDAGPREPPEELVTKLIPLLDDGISEEVARAAIRRTLSDAMWMWFGEETAGVEIEHLLAFVQERTDEEIVEAIEAVRTGETMAELVARLGEIEDL